MVVIKRDIVWCCAARTAHEIEHGVRLELDTPEDPTAHFVLMQSRPLHGADSVVAALSHCPWCGLRLRSTPFFENPWPEAIVVPLDELIVAIVAGRRPDDMHSSVESMRGFIGQYGAQVDPYVLLGSQIHSSGVRYGREGREYLSLGGDNDALRLLGLKYRRRPVEGEDYMIESDGVTVWVNGRYGLIGRFGKMGIDVHRTPGAATHCADCSLVADWGRFKAGMLRVHAIDVPDTYKPAGGE